MSASGSRSGSRGSEASSREKTRHSAAEQAKLHRASKILFGKGKKAKKKEGPAKSLHWRDKRPLTVGNWAVPEHLQTVPDIEEWKRPEVERYFCKFVRNEGSLSREERIELERKITFLSHGSNADFHAPLQNCCVDHEVNLSAARLACLRTEEKEDACIVKRHTEQKFHIPQLGIEEAMAKIANRDEDRSMIQRLQSVGARRSSHAQLAGKDGEGGEEAAPPPLKAEDMLVGGPPPTDAEMDAAAENDDSDDY